MRKYNFEFKKAREKTLKTNFFVLFFQKPHEMFLRPTTSAENAGDSHRGFSAHLDKCPYPLIGLIDDVICKSLGHLTGSVLGPLQRMVQVAL